MGHGTGHPPATAEALALALLAVPATLSDAQRQGQVCVWRGEALTADSVRLSERDIDGRAIFPRACRPCTGTAAYTALFDHAPGCAACVAHGPSCTVGTALRRLIRDGRR
jgi:hypothetical protein